MRYSRMMIALILSLFVMGAFANQSSEVISHAVIKNKNLPFAQPVPVKIEVSTKNDYWVQTISVCNISSQVIPLKNLEFEFQYSAPMPANIWGQPWVAWKLVQQDGNKVLLAGGTPWSPDLQADPSCIHPLTIQFNADPSLPQPTGPYELRSEGAQPVGVGSITVTLQSAPQAGLPDPTITLQGMGEHFQKTLQWGEQWVLNNLSPGSYQISASPVDNGDTFYKMDPQTISVQANVTTPVTLQYQTVPAEKVTVNFVNAPEIQEPVSLKGNIYSFHKTLSNQSLINLPFDTYQITSNVPGYAAIINPNPITVPDQTNIHIQYQKTILSSQMVGYFMSWAPDSEQINGTLTNLANLPEYINVVNLAFMRPDALYQKGSMTFSGTGLEFQYQDGMVLKNAIVSLHQKHPQTKVLISVGGASYQNWNNFNPVAIANFVTDFGLDGVDIDYEPSVTGCALGSDNLIHCNIDQPFQSFVASLRQLLPRPYILTVAAMSVGAYGEGAWQNATPESQHTGMMLPLLRSVAAKDIDMISVMAYDAGLSYQPVQALKAYHHYFSGAISMGIQVPPEAWGGHVYTLCEVNQLADAVKNEAASHNESTNMMIWALQKKPSGAVSPNNPSAQLIVSALCHHLGLNRCSEKILING